MNGNFKEKFALLRDYLRTHWFAVLLGGIFVIVLGVWYATRGWGIAKPPPPLPPAEFNAAFGKLPRINPRAVVITNPNAVTFSGTPRIAEPQSVMSMYPYIGVWLKESDLSTIAKELGINAASQQKGTVLIWSDGKKHLSADLTKGYFEYSESFADEVGEWGNIALPDRGKLQTMMENRMENLSPSSLAGQLELKDIRYYSIVGNHLVPVEEPANAKIAEGTFGRKFDKFKVYSDNPKSGVASIQISPIRKTVRIRFELKSLNVIQKATYPLKTVEEAWHDLQAGRGFLVYLYDVRGKKELSDFSGYDLESVNISKAELAYYEASVFGAYLQPIYVFTGSGVVRGGYPVEARYYIQAVADEWLR